MAPTLTLALAQFQPKKGDYAANLGLQIALELEPFKLSLLNEAGDAPTVYLALTNTWAARPTPS